MKPNIDLREIIQRIEIIDLVTITPLDLRNYLDHRLANYHKKSNDLIDDDGVIAFVELLSKQGANRGAAEHDFLTPLNIGNLMNRCLNVCAAIHAPIITKDIVGRK